MGAHGTRGHITQRNRCHPERDPEVERPERVSFAPFASSDDPPVPAASRPAAKPLPAGDDPCDVRLSAAFALFADAVAGFPAPFAAAVPAPADPPPFVPDDDAAPPAAFCDSADPVVPLSAALSDVVSAVFAPDCAAPVDVRVVGASARAARSDAGLKRSAGWDMSPSGRIDTVAASPAPGRP